MNVDVLGNFGLTSSTIDPVFPQTGKWYEYFTGDSVTVANIDTLISLQPGEYRLYTTKKLASPKYLLGVEEQEQAEKEGFISVYPNPSSEIFNFVIKSPYPAPVSIFIYDLSGRIVRQLKTDVSPEGTETVTWDGRMGNGSEASAGIYIVQIYGTMRFGTVKVIKK